MTPAAEKGESEMSGSIDAINGNGMSLQFEEFARIAESSSKKTNVVRFLGSSSSATLTIYPRAFQPRISRAP